MMIDWCLTLIWFDSSHSLIHFFLYISLSHSSSSFPTLSTFLFIYSINFESKSLNYEYNRRLRIFFYRAASRMGVHRTLKMFSFFWFWFVFFFFFLFFLLGFYFSRSPIFTLKAITKIFFDRFRSLFISNEISRAMIRMATTITNVHSLGEAFMWLYCWDLNVRISIYLNIELCKIGKQEKHIQKCCIQAYFLLIAVFAHFNFWLFFHC